MLIATDVFPPKCSGSGWSSYYLARELRRRGHEVAVARPRFAPGEGAPRIDRASYDGLPVGELRIPTGGNALSGLLARNISGPRALRRFVAGEAERLGAEVVHAQHMLTTPAAVAGASDMRRKDARRAPAVVSTVRDYWPISHFTTMHLGSRNPLDVGLPCPDCGTLPGLLRGLLRAQGAAGLARWPVAPLWHLAALRRRAALGRADAVIAVSRYVAGTLLRARAIAKERLTVVPNLVDVERVAEIAAGEPPLEKLGLRPGEGFLLFAGKLDAHKGAQLLPRAVAGAGGALPLVIAGEGPLRQKVESESRALGIDLRLAEWLSNEDVLRLMRRSTLLLVPSVWQEPLSRVLLEGAAAGATILALDTGGTRDAIEDGHTGALAGDMEEFARRLAALLAAPEQRERLRSGARRTARERFDGPVVAAKVEDIYARALARHG